MSEDGAIILVIDDEPQMRKLLKVTLQAHGYQVVEAATGMDGLREATTAHPDLIVLDLGLPDMEGIDLLAQIREWSQIPVIVVTARDREDEKIRALDGGADDYVTKPFGMGELVARIRVALRHVANVVNEPVMRVGHLVIDLAQRGVEKDGERVKLTKTEYDLLKVLAVNAGRIMTHRQLLQQVWGGQAYDTASHYLRIYIGHLRKKLEDDPTRPQMIVTEPGIGYRLVTDE